MEAQDFFVDQLTSVLEADELLVEIEVPSLARVRHRLRRGRAAHGDFAPAGRGRRARADGAAAISCLVWGAATSRRGAEYALGGGATRRRPRAADG